MSEFNGRALLVDDDEVLLGSLEQWLGLSGFEVRTAGAVGAAVAEIDRQEFDVVLTDLRMPGQDGMQLLAHVRENKPDLPVVILTGHGDVPQAVQATRAGAYDFIEKPYDPDRLVVTLRNAARQARLQRRLHAAEQQLKGDDCVSARLMGTSFDMVRLQAEIRSLLSAPLDVLIAGETGAGKEVVARALHACGPRHTKPFVAINCAAIPADIVESELFGHEPGAFTGASSVRIGKFEFANGGTLFLDEIESMPLAAQGKLLRALQERAIERVGGNKSISIDIRVISATKSDLRKAAEAGQFRADLFYRLAGYEIEVPPLRRRGDDLLLLFRHYARLAADAAGKPEPELPAAAIAAIFEYAWPGNVRELRSVAERYGMGLGLRIQRDVASEQTVSAGLEQMLDDYERRLILTALQRADGSVSKALEALQVPRRTLNEKMRRLGIARKPSGAGDQP
ncbi:sigma-54-dependent transcriptional regulator [Bradyrhizobium sp. HKCCYLS20291]|uniref:sigma-54-dependent transcriptional regulator n=1 Tax=Bradyrhizobium sp. HKCCYLS20291 TaxID=3420766 RepID=UPI003EB8CB8B